MPLRLIALTESGIDQQGHCFIAPLPGGLVDGDAADRRKSGLILFENGLALGPAHSSPRGRARGAGNGAYSHWGRDLWLSSSDNSSPLVNGRIYAVVAVDGNDPGDLLPPRAAAGQAPVNLQPLDASAEAIEARCR